MDDTHRNEHEGFWVLRSRGPNELFATFHEARDRAAELESQEVVLVIPAKRPEPSAN